MLNVGVSALCILAMRLEEIKARPRPLALMFCSSPRAPFATSPTSLIADMVKLLKSESRLESTLVQIASKLGAWRLLRGAPEWRRTDSDTDDKPAARRSIRARRARARFSSVINRLDQECYPRRVRWAGRHCGSETASTLIVCLAGARAPRNRAARAA